MKKILALFFALLLLTMSFSACGKGENNSESESGVTAQADKVNVEIDIKSYGKITLELDAKNAPISVANFVELAKSGFYDGLTFHRIMDGFMMQGGNAEGTGKSAQSIKGEFSNNGVNNPLKHTRGAISMARVGGLNDSASSQFFIVHKDSLFLDGEYAAFGYVTSGIEIVDKICSETPVVDNNGTVEKPNQPIINSIKVIG